MEPSLESCLERLLGRLLDGGDRAVSEVIAEISSRFGWECAGHGERRTPAKAMIVEADRRQLYGFVCAAADSAIDVSAVDLMTAGAIAHASLRAGDFELGIRVLERIFRAGAPELALRWASRYFGGFRAPDRRLRLLGVYLSMVGKEAPAYFTAFGSPRDGPGEPAVIAVQARAAMDELHALPSPMAVCGAAVLLLAPFQRLGEAVSRSLLSSAPGADAVKALLDGLVRAGATLDGVDRRSQKEAVQLMLAQLAVAEPYLRDSPFEAGHAGANAHFHYLAGDWQALAESLDRARRLGAGVDPRLAAFSAFVSGEGEVAGSVTSGPVVDLPPPADRREDWVRFRIARDGADAFLPHLERFGLSPPEYASLLRAAQSVDPGLATRIAVQAGALLEGPRLGALVSALADVWRPDLCVRLAPPEDEAAEWPVNIVRKLVFAFLVCGERDRAYRLARTAFGRDPFNPPLAALMRYLGEEDLVRRGLERERGVLLESSSPDDRARRLAAAKIAIQLQDLSLARSLLRVASANGDGDSELVYLEAQMLEAEGRDREALQAYEALMILEDASTRARMGCVRSLFELGDFERASRCARQSPLDAQGSGEPDPAFDLMQFNTALAMGRPGEAFKLYRGVTQRAQLRELVGDACSRDRDILTADGRLLILAQGGPGDEIRFASLYGALSNRPGETVLTCDPRLLTIMRRSFPRLVFLPVWRYRKEILGELPGNLYAQRSKAGRLHFSMDNAAVDVASGAGHVALIYDVLMQLRKDREAFPRLGAYLRIAPESDEHWRSRLRRAVGGRIAVGLCWRSMLMSVARSRHYSDLADWEPLFAQPGIAVVNLQTGITDAERHVARSRGWTLHEFPDLDLRDDFEATGGLMRALDWVVAPCVTTLEFAGALGVRATLFAGSQQLAWRRREDGSDIWHASVEVDRPHRASAFRLAAERITARILDQVPAGIARETVRVP